MKEAEVTARQLELQTKNRELDILNAQINLQLAQNTSIMLGLLAKTLDSSRSVDNTNSATSDNVVEEPVVFNVIEME